LAIAVPSPPPAPVTSATFPCNRITGLLGYFCPRGAGLAVAPAPQFSIAPGASPSRKHAGYAWHPRRGASSPRANATGDPHWVCPFGSPASPIIRGRPAGRPARAGATRAPASAGARRAAWANAVGRLTGATPVRRLTGGMGPIPIELAGPQHHRPGLEF